MRFTANDVIALESGETSHKEATLLLQKAINSGSAWLIQGSYGASMMTALEYGNYMPGQDQAHDAAGNHIRFAPVCG